MLMLLSGKHFSATSVDLNVPYVIWSDLTWSSCLTLTDEVNEPMLRPDLINQF